jgi:hypothetical protein
MNLDIFSKKYGKTFQVKNNIVIEFFFVIYHVSVKFHIKKLGEIYGIP